MKKKSEETKVSSCLSIIIKKKLKKKIGHEASIKSYCSRIFFHFF